MICAHVDDSYFKFIIEGLSEGCYIEESFSMWQITPKGVRYLQEYERRLNVGSDWSIEGNSSARERKREEEMQDKALQRSNAKWTKYGFFITLISALLGLLYFLWENIL